MTPIQPSEGWWHQVWNGSLSTSEEAEDLQEDLGGERMRRLAASMSGSSTARAAVCALGFGMAN